MGSTHKSSEQQCNWLAEQNASDARTLLRKGSFSGLRDTVKYAPWLYVYNSGPCQQTDLASPHQACLQALLIDALFGPSRLNSSTSQCMNTCRALGEFATEAGTPQDKAGQLVNNFLASLQTFDNTLISSLRNKTAVPDTADKEVEQAVQDLDRWFRACHCDSLLCCSIAHLL